jgi:hypothetical protein
VIAGHKRAGRDDDPRIIEETRQYIRDVDRIAESTASARHLYEQVLALHPTQPLGARIERVSDRVVRSD